MKNIKKTLREMQSLSTIVGKALLIHGLETGFTGVSELPLNGEVVFAIEESLMFYFYGFATENGVETVEDAAEEMAEIENRMYGEDGDDESGSTDETDEGDTETAIDGDAVADHQRLESRMWDGFIGLADELSGDGGEG